MKIWTSLRTYFFVAMIMIGILVVVTYSYVSGQYYVIGIKNVVEWTMRDIAASWRDGEIPADKQSLANAQNIAGYQVSPSWELVPEIIKQKLPQAKTDNDTFYGLLEHSHEQGKKGDGVIYHMGKFSNGNGGFLYISRTVNANNIPQEIKQTSREIWRWTLYVGIITGAAFIFLVFLVIRSAATPIGRLNRWASSLNENNIGEQRPNFRYKELNDLAHLIQNSLLSVRNALDREQELLRNCSHELRTPIAVISNNLELLQKLHPTDNKQELQVMDRMSRAAKTMADLTDTLLRLAQTDSPLKDVQPIALDCMIEQLCDQLNYLLVGKPVTVKKNLCKTTLSLPKLGTQIILNNLIRNAYQHTLSGQIDIILSSNQVQIINDVQHSDVSQAHEAGYGLGLKLCKKIAGHFQWNINIESNDHHHQVTVVFTN